ncbi:MAG: DUF4136 domain-containing protein [Gammaproteobacteria bacterium]|nr:DUF4136 domain-containing protein [Gammaproteobacteria bacterium]
MLTPQRPWIVLLLATLSGCSTMQISSDYDASTNFAGLKTYNWIPGPQKVSGDPKIDPFIEKRVRDAVDNQLAAQGYDKRSSGTPDFLVGFHVALEKKLAVSTMNEYYGVVVGPRWHHSTPRWYGSETYVYDYDEGSLILDIIEAGSRKLIWRGFALARVDTTASAERKTKRINEAVERILAQFPPKPK